MKYLDIRLPTYRVFQKKRPNVCLFNFSGTNEQISKPFFFSLKTEIHVNFEYRTNFVRL